MSVRVLLVLLVLQATAAGAVPSNAVAGWSDVAVVWEPEQPTHNTGRGLLEFSPSGVAVAFWTPAVAGDRGGYFGLGTRVSTRLPGGEFSQAALLVPGVTYLPTGLSVDRSSRVLLLADVHGRDPQGDFRKGVRAFRGSLGEGGALAMGRGQTLSGRPALSGLAANARGDAVAVWRDGDSETALGRVRAVVSYGARRFGRPVVITGGRAWSSAAAINERGDAVVVWQEGRAIYARFAPRGGQFGRRLTVGRASRALRFADFIGVAVGPSGHVFVGWARSSLTASAIVAAEMAPGGRFTRALKLDEFPTAHDLPAAHPAVAASGPDDFLIAWNGVDVRLASVTAGAANTVTVDAGRALAPKLVALAGGGALVGWQAATGTFTAVRRPDGQLGPAEQIGAPETTGARFAVDPLSGEPWAIYNALDPRRLVVARHTP